MLAEYGPRRSSLEDTVWQHRCQRHVAILTCAGRQRGARQRLEGRTHLNGPRARDRNGVVALCEEPHKRYLPRRRAVFRAGILQPSSELEDVQKALGRIFADVVQVFSTW